MTGVLRVMEESVLLLVVGAVSPLPLHFFPLPESVASPSLRESEMCFSCFFPIQIENEKAPAVW